MEKRQEGADSSLALYFSASRLTCLLRETVLGVGDGDAVRFAGRLGGRNVDVKGDPDLGDTTRSGNLMSSSDTNFKLTIRECNENFMKVGWVSRWGEALVIRDIKDEKPGGFFWTDTRWVTQMKTVVHCPRLRGKRVGGGCVLQTRDILFGSTSSNLRPTNRPTLSA